jgi:hypothetical protein
MPARSGRGPVVVRCSALLLLLSSTALADVPGTFDDPILELGIRPEIADAPLAQDLILRGDRVAVEFEGFELPTVFHHRLRSMITHDSKLGLDSADVEFGGASHFLIMGAPREMPHSAQVTSIDIGVSTLRVAPIATDDTSQYFDVVFVLGPLKAIATEKFARVVYSDGRQLGSWRYKVFVSPLIDESGAQLDGRGFLEYRGRAAGLQQLVWRLGVDVRHGITPHEIDAGWTWATAHLSKNIIADAGVRVDTNGVQPRGALEAQLPANTVAKLEAGAYRHDDGMRVTEIAATVSHKHGAFEGQLAAFYQDRLAAPAFGSAAGIELISTVEKGHWLGFLSASLSKSVQHDFDRARAHPTTFDQPVRLNAVVRYKRVAYTIAARFQLSSGLPYLPVVDSTYDSDSDAYRPIFALRYDRLPLHHEVSVRFDFPFTPKAGAFIDVRNAYAADTALGYAYSYDYKTRVDVTLPILPFVGVRGEL